MKKSESPDFKSQEVGISALGKSGMGQRDIKNKRESEEQRHFLYQFVTFQKAFHISGHNVQLPNGMTPDTFWD